MHFDLSKISREAVYWISRYQANVDFMTTQS